MRMGICDFRFSISDFMSIGEDRAKSKSQIIPKGSRWDKSCATGRTRPSARKSKMRRQSVSDRWISYYAAFMFLDILLSLTCG